MFALAWEIKEGCLIAESHMFATYDEASKWLKKSKLLCKVIGNKEHLSAQVMYAQEVKDELIKAIQRAEEADSARSL